MDEIQDWFLKVGMDAVRQVLMTVLGFILSWFLFIRRYLGHRRRLSKGETDSVIFQMHSLVPVPESRNGQVQLIFRNVAPNTTVEHLYDNPAATPFERETWLFVMTCEDKQVVRKASIRCFLIRPSDLEKFLDWNWCQSVVTVEADSHWYRVVALHQIALAWTEEKNLEAQRAASQEKSQIDRKATHSRVRKLSVGLYPNEKPVAAPIEIPWWLHEDFLKKYRIEVGT